jgi:hypothetical protein
MGAPLVASYHYRGAAAVTPGRNPLGETSATSPVANISRSHVVQVRSAFGRGGPKIRNTVERDATGAMPWRPSLCARRRGPHRGCSPRVYTPQPRPLPVTGAGATRSDATGQLDRPSPQRHSDLNNGQLHPNTESHRLDPSPTGLRFSPGVEVRGLPSPQWCAADLACVRAVRPRRTTVTKRAGP